VRLHPAQAQEGREASATFFGASHQEAEGSLVEELATQNAYLVTNLAYTFSITARIAQTTSSAHDARVHCSPTPPTSSGSSRTGFNQYVTTVTNPDDHRSPYLSGGDRGGGAWAPGPPVLHGKPP
jgi:hypothetical protein